MKIKFALIALLAMFVFSGCSDDDSPYKCSDCADEPEAAAANNNTGAGIYKGVLIGSSGTLYINMNNDGSGTLSMTLVIDGDEFELETESTFSDGNFEGYFINDKGTESEADDIRIGFYVNSTGTSWEFFGIQIPGHDDIKIEIIKELSTALVMGFEGTYSGEPGGTFNMVIRKSNDGGFWYAISRNKPTDEDPEPSTTFLEGSITNDLEVFSQGDVTIEGKVSGDLIKGTWESGDETGTWKGKRTL